jgi:hypothetical protein
VVRYELGNVKILAGMPAGVDVLPRRKVVKIEEVL